MLFALLALFFYGAHSNAEVVTPTKSIYDDKQYRGLLLENGMKVMLVSDADTDRAAASLDVHVGSGSDPTGWNGLAHFLEHMLFLGTEKYPQAGEYQDFIQTHGGRHNAYTAYDHTNYFFSIEYSKLEPALDRFSRFFIDPTFEGQYVQREREVVHSEYQARLQDEGRRTWAAQKQLLNPGHPASRFSVGSTETLRDRNGITVRDKLVEFYHRWYSSNIMAITVVGRESLDQLEEMVREKFDKVPNHDISPPLYKQAYLNKEIRPVRQDVVPLKDVHSVTFQFVIPSLKQDYESKPLSFIANLLGHEGEGSLLAALKSKGWADSLSAGSGFMDRFQGVFSVSIGLTEPGVDHVEEIGAMLFHYIELIRGGLENWRYDEDAALAKTAFRFAEERGASGLARSLSARMHDYPLKEVLSAPYLFKKFDTDRIQQVLDRIRPEHTYMQVVSQKLKPRKVSPYYAVKYQNQPIAKQIIDQWALAPKQDYSELSLPAPNPYVPERLELLELASVEEVPERIANDDGIDAWYRADQEFNTPRARFYFSLKSPVTNATPRDTVLTEIWIRLLNDRLNESTYPARLAGLEFSIYRHSRGISVRVGGYADKLPVLLQLILDNLKDTEFKSEKLSLIKANYIRELKNNLKERPSSQTVREIYRLLMTPLWTESERLAEIASVSVDEVQSHVAATTETLSITSLSHGDVSQKASDDMTQTLLAAFDHATLIPNTPRAKIRKLKENARYIRNLQINHPDTAIAFYYQGQSKSTQERALSSLLGQLLENPFYFDLRTTHNVGYLVFGASFEILEVPGVVLSVQSPSHNAVEIADLYNQFIEGFPSQLQNLSEAEFTQAKQGLIARILQRDKRLADRTNRYWQEIDLGQLSFDSREQLVSEIQQLTKDNLINYFQKIVLEQPRKIVVQAPGTRDQSREVMFKDQNAVIIGAPPEFRQSAEQFFPTL